MQLQKAAQNGIKYGISKVGVVSRARDRLGIIDIISCIIELFIRSQFEMTQPNGWNYAIHRARNELWTVGVGPNHDTTNMPRPAASAWNSNPSWTPAHYDFSAFHVARLIKSCFSSHAQRRSQVASSQHVVSIPHQPYPLTPTRWQAAFHLFEIQTEPVKMHRAAATAEVAAAATRNEVLSSQIDFGLMLLISCW